MSWPGDTADIQVHPKVAIVKRLNATKGEWYCNGIHSAVRRPVYPLAATLETARFQVHVSPSSSDRPLFHSPCQPTTLLFFPSCIYI